MPVIKSKYQAPVFTKQGDIQTLYASLFRKISVPPTISEIIATLDGDFLRINWSRVGSNKIAILSHGLEGHTERKYMQGMTKALNTAGLDTLAWNFRFAGGTPHKRLRLTHNGSIDDLQAVVDIALKAKPKYQEIFLVGFSMGGNITLNFLGKFPDRVSSVISKVVCISVPCDLKSCAYTLAQKRNWIYMQNFLKTMLAKIKELSRLHPNQIDVSNLNSIKTFKDFDDRFTGPMHGFKDALDYWNQCSSLPFLKNISVPTLLLSALDDPFLPKECYPDNVAHYNPHFYLETPKYGGHVGFIQNNPLGQYYSESRAVEFFTAL